MMVRFVRKIIKDGLKGRGRSHSTRWGCGGGSSIPSDIPQAKGIRQRGANVLYRTMMHGGLIKIGLKGLFNHSFPINSYMPGLK
jgi:hypothetical protein